MHSSYRVFTKSKVRDNRSSDLDGYPCLSDAEKNWFQRALLEEYYTWFRFLRCMQPPWSWMITMGLVLTSSSTTLDRCHISPDVLWTQSTVMSLSRVMEKTDLLSFSWDRHRMSRINWVHAWHIKQVFYIYISMYLYLSLYRIYILCCHWMHWRLSTRHVCQVHTMQSE